ncbi:conserved hypothetical protein [Desulfamplus magnetovallimortis]|uniref:Uncharacterized protein n=1 Tax=Desulfamplus magnetovallimortis TaxID=1246637 RepID=A0A1W1H755_9BACT|nr:hypothetical protein [Desulfamplus magnetovallimortis]SLM28218.1 conserved hypothetical protein [Desulfamplus magnetovallimortis]
MIIHDGIYEWDGRSTDGRQPICWWPGSYWMRIVDLTLDIPNMVHLKSHAVILKNRGKGTSLRNYIQNFAKIIAEKYNLNIEKTLWVEIIVNGNGDPEDILIANINCVSRLFDRQLFSAMWRPARPNELKLLDPWLFDMLDSQLQDLNA